MIETLYKPFRHWSECNGVWIISDTHFGEDDLKEAFPNRPSDEQLIKNINQKVGRTGTLILLGDVGDLNCAKQLKGYKVLVQGNHDSGASNYETIFDEVYSGPLMIAEKLILSHEPLNIDWAYNIHGHRHSEKADDRFVGRFNVCADVIGYEPISLNAFIKSGLLKEIEGIHRETIDNATERARKRGKRKADLKDSE